MKKTAILALCLSMLSASTADACGRCGLFGRRCSFVQKQVVVKKQAVAYAYQQPQNVTNLSIINAYPAATSQYGVAQIAQAYQTNPDLAVTLSARIAEQATNGLTAAIKSQQQSAAASVELQRLALATEHMRAAMGSSQSQEASSMSVQVRQGSGAGGTDSAEHSLPQSGSLLSQKCSKCHGLDLREPKGQLYLDDGHQLDASSSVAAIRVISGLDVPEPMRDVITSLTEQERCQLLVEIATLSRR